MARFLRAALASCLLILGVPQAAAQNENVLIQTLAGGAVRLWHGEGPSLLDDDELLRLDAEADADAASPLPTSLGPARARRTERGVVIELLDAKQDRFLFIDRDACGHVKAWHSEGATRLSEDQVVELLLSALPGGGARVALDAGRLAKAYLTPVGVMVAIWKPREPRR